MLWKRINFHKSLVIAIGIEGTFPMECTNILWCNVGDLPSTPWASTLYWEVREGILGCGGRKNQKMIGDVDEKLPFLTGKRSVDKIISRVYPNILHVYVQNVGKCL